MEDASSFLLTRRSGEAGAIDEGCGLRRDPCRAGNARGCICRFRRILGAGRGGRRVDPAGLPVALRRRASEGSRRGKGTTGALVLGERAQDEHRDADRPWACVETLGSKPRKAAASAFGPLPDRRSRRTVRQILTHSGPLPDPSLSPISSLTGSLGICLNAPGHLLRGRKIWYFSVCLLLLLYASVFKLDLPLRRIQRGNSQVVGS